MESTQIELSFENSLLNVNLRLTIDVRLSNPQYIAHTRVLAAKKIW